MAAPYKWYVPDASAGGDGDSYETAYNNINTAFSALSATYYILNIVPTLTGVIPSAPIALSGLKGASTTFRYLIRLTDLSGNILADDVRFTLDGNNSLTNIFRFVDCAFMKFRGLEVKRAAQANLNFLTTASNEIWFEEFDTILAGTNGISNANINNVLKFYHCKMMNNGGVGIQGWGANGRGDLIKCVIANNTLSGFAGMGTDAQIQDCIISKNGGNENCATTTTTRFKNCIFDGHATRHVNTIGIGRTNFDSCLFSNAPIGVVQSTQYSFLKDCAFYNVTNPYTVTTGFVDSVNETILTEDPYTNQAISDYNLKANYLLRRKSVMIDGYKMGQTAGIPGADIIYPRIDSLDKTVLPLAGGTIVATGIGLTGATGFTLGGVACTVVVDSDTQITITVPTLTAGLKSLAGTTTAGAVSLANCVTAQAGASKPEDFLANAVAWGVQSVKVGWGASAGAMTYRVKRDGVDVSGELRNVSSFVDSPVAAGTYEYVVVAENDVDDTSSNTITLTKGAGGLATIYGVLSAIYRAMFNMQKIEKVGSTYYLNTYDDDDTTLVASCALKTFDEADIGDLAGTVTPSIRLKSAISGVGAELTGTIWERVQSVFKKEFNTRKNEEVVVGSGVVSEVLYDDNDTTKISQQALKTFNGDNLPSQLNTTTPSQRMRSSI